MNHLFLNLYKLVDLPETRWYYLYMGTIYKIMTTEGDEYTKFPFVNIWVKRLR